MTETDTAIPAQTEPAGYLSTMINILTAPAEAFSELDQRPTKLFPLAVIMISTMLVMFWYFSILDFDWYIDDALSVSDLTEAEMEAGRELMESMSQTTFKMLGVFGGVFFLLVLYTLQSGYLALASALSGDHYKFGHWFSLICWTSIPYLLSIMGQAVNIFLSPNGQLSSFDLDPLTLANLGMQSSNGSIDIMMNFLSLPMIWSLILVVMAYKQWLESSIVKACSIVLAPYALILGVWAYFALT